MSFELTRAIVSGILDGAADLCQRAWLLPEREMRAPSTLRIVFSPALVRAADVLRAKAARVRFVQSERSEHEEEQQIIDDAGLGIFDSGRQGSVRRDKHN